MRLNMQGTPFFAGDALTQYFIPRFRIALTCNPARCRLFNLFHRRIECSQWNAGLIHADVAEQPMLGRISF
ncbi:MAG: hypothetical protein ACJ8G3_09515 [Burkholderiaceae bacterium]